MTTSFPGALDSFTTKVDAVDYVLAAHVNNIQDSIIALETYAFDKAIGANLLYSTLSHDIWPQGVTFTGILDDVYANLWNSLHSGTTPTITGVAGGSTDPFKRYLKFANGGTAYGGIVQFLSSEDTVPLRGLPVSISADLWGTNVTTVRMAVISWTSTADAVTSDVVGVWGAGNPTLATNWAYIGTPADITITTTRTRFQVDNLTVPTTANNIALFIWIPNQEASGDFFNVARVKLEKGTVATEFVAPPFSEEIIGQGQFMETPLDLSAVTPTTGVSISLSTWANTIPTNRQYGQQFFKIRKYKAPAVTIYPYTTVANTSRVSTNAGVDLAASSGVAVSITTTQFGVQNNSGADAVTGNNLILFSWLADARL